VCPCLAYEDFASHVGYSLVPLHGVLPFR
jgi:hypothetical protein